MNQSNDQLMNSSEKPAKNLSNVFRDIDEKKIQSDAKDIEDDSHNILQLRRNRTMQSTSHQNVEQSQPLNITSSASIQLHSNETDSIESQSISVANVTSANDGQTTEQTPKRRRRHRQRR